MTGAFLTLVPPNIPHCQILGHYDSLESSIGVASSFTGLFAMAFQQVSFAVKNLSSLFQSICARI